MSRHAYLVVTHNQFDFLEMLLRDFEDNDVYLHVDKKANSFDEKYFKSNLEKSGLTIISKKTAALAGDIVSQRNSMDKMGWLR